MKTKIIDLFLVIIIVVSLALVVSRATNWFNGGKGRPEPALIGHNWASSIVGSSADEVRSGPFIGWLRALTAPQWEKVVTENKLTAAQVSETSGCMSAEQPSLPSITVSSMEVAKKFASGALNIMVGFRSTFCLRKGAKALLVMRSTEKASQVLQPMGFIEIKDVLVSSLDALPESFFVALGISGLEYREALTAGGARIEGTKEIFLRTQFLEKVTTPPTLPPRGFSFAEPVTAQWLSQEKKTGAAIHIIDVRTPEEFAQHHIQGAVNIPLILPPSISAKFSWNVTTAQLSDVRFDTAKLLSLQRTGRFVVVGSGPQDSRPVWMLLTLLYMRFDGLAWLYDGVNGH